MNADELQEELEGSRRDIREGCRSVDILHYRTAQPWMHQPVQAAFVILVKQSARFVPSPAVLATSALTFYAAAAMPFGYQRIHPVLSAGTAVGAAVDERTVFASDSDDTYYPTLNGVLMKHSAQYRMNKEDELNRKLQLLADAYGERGSEGEEDERS